MSDMVVVVPTRGRPENARRLYEAIERSTNAWPAFVIDEDDPALPEYKKALPGVSWMIAPRHRPGIVDPLNWAATRLVEIPLGWSYISFMGDDHLPQGDNWDIEIIEALDELGTGVVYGNDLLQGELLPTAVFMTSDIVRTLGYMAIPNLNHLFVDNYWLELGKGIGRIKYLENTIIEHLHPLNGKSEWDPTYSHCNDNAAPKDGFIWEALKRGGYIDRDIEKVKALL